METSAAIASLIDISSRRRAALDEETFATFIDLRKAFDTVSIGALIFKLKQYGVCGKMLNFVENLYGNSFAVVRCGEFISDSFEWKQGVRQGCPISGLLFIIFINDFFDGIDNVKIDAINKVLPGILYADDAALLSANAADHQIALNLITAWAKKWNMSFGIAKCGTMTIHPKSQNIATPFQLDNQPVPIVSTYKYLGIYINKTLDRVQMYKCKDQKAKAILNQLTTPILTNAAFTSSCKVYLIKVLLNSYLQYGLAAIGGFFDCRILQPVINKAIRQIFNLPMLTPIAPMLVASTVYSFSAIGLAARLKLYKKYKTLVGNLLSRLLNTPLSCRKSYWTKQTVSLWSKYSLEQHLSSTKREFNKFVQKGLPNWTIESYKSNNARRYFNYKFDQCSSFIFNIWPSNRIQQAAHMLFRIQLNATWTAKRAIKRNLLCASHPFSIDKCIMCEEIMELRYARRL